MCTVFAFISVAAYAAQPKTWTFLIFINGNNNLDRFGEDNIKALEKVGSNDQVNIVVQRASYSSRNTVRMLIKKSTNPNKITSPVLENLGEVDMGDYHSLENFIDWGVKNFPADHYFIDVWNHGSGWHRGATGKASSDVLVHRYDISWDDISGHSIKTEELGQVMAHAAKLIGHKVDIYGSDACLMAMAEVAGEMADSVSYFVGSQELEPGAGWPYDKLMQRWEAIPSATAPQIADILTDEYIKAYHGYDDDVAFSAMDLSKLPALNNALKEFGAEVSRLSSDDKRVVRRAAEQSVKFGDGDYVDLIDFTRHLTASDLHRLNLQTIQNVEQAAKEMIISNAVGPELTDATGLSIWLPGMNDYKYFSDRYEGLVFSKDAGWGATLKSLIIGL